MKKSKLHFYFKISFIFLIISGIIAAGVFFFSISNYFSGDGEQVIYSNEMYTLKGNPTDYQKEIFKELTAVVENTDRGDLELPEAVVKNFIADFYTWNNKIGSYDIGGEEFIYYKEVTNFIRTMRHSTYLAITDYINNGLSTKDLIEINHVEITASNYASDYEYYGTTFSAYYIEATWTFAENDKIDTSIFPTWGAFTIIKDTENENRYEIVRFY